MTIKPPGHLIAAALVLAASGLGSLAGRVDAQSSSRQSATVAFAEQRPGVPTALGIDIDYVNPADPAAKPPAVRTVVLELAEGSRIDTAVTERCTAPDAQLMAQGAGACPAASRLGGGSIRIDTGLPGPARFLHEELTLLNSSSDLIFLLSDRSSGARIVSRNPIQGRRVTSSAPPLPGAPPDGASIDVVHERIAEVTRRVGEARLGYITTPGECPTSGAWSNSIHFTYADGATQTVATRSPCVESGRRAGRCANLWNGSPRGDRHAGTRRGDRIFGFAGADRLSGRGGADCLFGQRGNDRLRGRRGRDRLSGGRGGDRLRGGAGRDLIRGGAGNDAIYARGGGRDRVRCGTGADTVRADPGDRVSPDCGRPGPA